jgi:hypothetical protein
MRQWLYPYSTLFGDVELRVEALTVDGVAVPGSHIDVEQRQVRLIDLERAGWARAELDVSVRGPATEIAARVSDGEWPQGVVVVTCGPTNGRQAVALDPEPDDASMWRGRVELERSGWFGRIDIAGLIEATVEGIADRVIGVAAAWSVRLDDVPPPPVHGSINIRWQDFNDPDEALQWLKNYAGEPSFLRLDDDQPVLYLNRAFEGLKALLDRKPSRPPGEHALHDQTRATLATEAWAAIFNASLQAIRAGEVGEAVDWPQDEWKRVALEILLSRVYPEKALDDALEEAAKTQADPDAGGALQQAVATAVSQHVGVARLLRDSMRRLGRDTEGGS